ncbi:MAG: hypothetical protein V3V49_09140 [Candidatus Krumholzibacteria bacterium]
MITVLSPSIAAQETQADTPTAPDLSECVQAKKDAAAAAKGSGGYFVFGFLCGVIGFVAAAISKPTPPAEAILGKSDEYVICYNETYRTESLSKNKRKACTGWAIGATVAIIIIAATSEE